MGRNYAKEKAAKKLLAEQSRAALILELKCEIQLARDPDCDHCPRCGRTDDGRGVEAIIAEVLVKCPDLAKLAFEHYERMITAADSPSAAKWAARILQSGVLSM